MTKADIKGMTRKERQAAKAAANAEARERWDDPQFHRELAAEITEAIIEGFEHESLIDLMSDVERVGLDDRITVRETRGLKAHWVALGGAIEESTLTSDVQEMTRSMLGFRVSEFEDKMQSSLVETTQTLVNLAIQRMTAQVNSYFLSCAQAAVPVGAANYTAGAGLNLTAINAAISEVRDEANGENPVIIGRAQVTEQIGDLVTGASGNNGSPNAFLPETNEELVATGRIGTYRSVPILTLRHYKDERGQAFFPANELWIMAPGASKFGFWGGLVAKEWVTDDNWYWNYMGRQYVGCMVHRPERMHRMVDTNIPA